MIPEYYANLLGLEGRDLEEFLVLIQIDEFLTVVVDDCAEQWRRLSGSQRSPQHIRRSNLARATLVAANTDFSMAQAGSYWRPSRCTFATGLSNGSGNSTRRSNPRETS